MCNHLIPPFQVAPRNVTTARHVLKMVLPLSVPEFHLRSYSVVFKLKQRNDHGFAVVYALIVCQKFWRWV